MLRKEGFPLSVVDVFAPTLEVTQAQRRLSYAMLKVDYENWHQTLDDLRALALNRL